MRIRLRQRVARLAVIIMLAVYVINVAYGFEGTGRRLRDFAFVSDLFRGVSEGKRSIAGNRFAETWLTAMRVPLPANYVLGIDLQRRDFERGMPSYLRGE